jgi:hypothetical protein
VKLIRREHRERERERERERCCRLGREGENEGIERENGVGFKLRSALADGLNKHKVFLAIANGHINTEIF